MQPFETIMTILTIASVGVLFVVAEPMIIVKRLLGFKEENIGKQLYKNNWVNVSKDFITKLLYCCQCSGFWITFIMTHDPVQAAIVSFFAELLGRKINN